MPDLYPVDLEEMIAEARRECAMRRQVYGRATVHGRMNPQTADRRIEVMDKILAFLERHKLAEKEPE